MRKNRTDPVKIVLGIAVGVLMLTATFFAVQYLGTIRRYDEDHNTEVVNLQNENNRIQLELTNAETRVTTLEDEIARLTEEIRLYVEITGADADYVSEMNTRLLTLRGELDYAKLEVKTLHDQIEALENLNKEDFSTKTRLITELMEMLLQKAPMRIIEPETDENKSFNDMEISEPTEVYPKLALYYKDLTTGYSAFYNKDEVMYTASLIKLPYVYAVLREIADFEYKKLYYADDNTPLYDEEGVPLFDGEHPNTDAYGNIIYTENEKKYDLNQQWVYYPETMFKEGSGIIQHKEAGFTLSYRELFEYTILHSDNIAFEQLRKIYGMDSFYDLVWRLGIKGTSYGFMQLSASDCVAVLEDIYKYFETEEKYALFLKDIMSRSAHSVMIPAAVSPVVCAHKYGWDDASYHDMGIVLDEHPYIIVIMTDLDEGGDRINSYIRGLVQKCREIHYSTYLTDS